MQQCRPSDIYDGSVLSCVSHSPFCALPHILPLPAGNDATMEDAEFCGLTDIVPVLGNGSDVGGTWFHGISTHARELLQNADVILAKGQGNYETMHGCGLNIYYLFLCKCDWFQQLFHAKLLQGMFVNEKRAPKATAFSSD